MKDTRPRPYEHFLHPYVFVLKEGAEIHKDFLDYSLLLLQMGQGDILRSPKIDKPLTSLTQHLFKR